MLKRIFLLVLAIAAGWIVWRWLQRREDEFGSATSQLAPIEPVARGLPAQPTAPAWSPAPGPPTVASPDIPADRLDTEIPERVEEAIREAEQLIIAEAPAVAETRTDAGEATDETFMSAPEAVRPESAPSQAASAQEELLASAPEAATPAAESAEAPSATAAPEEPAAPVEPAEVVRAIGGQEQPAASTVAEPAPAEQADDSGALSGVVGYCVRCKTKREIAGAHEETTESGRRAARGTCPVCGAKMFTFLPTE